MSIWRAKWAREAQEQRPLYRLTCNRCGEALLTYDPEISKVAHQTKHFGAPWDFSCRFWKADYEVVGVGPSELGTCRFNPPQLVVLSGEQFSLWPEVDRDEWCARYDRKRIVGETLKRLPPNTETVMPR